MGPVLVFVLVLVQFNWDAAKDGSAVSRLRERVGQGLGMKFDIVRSLNCDSFTEFV